MKVEEITTQEQYDKAKAELLKKYPDMPAPKPIECLNLLLRKTFAEQIIEGKKTVEFRDFSEYYCSRILDKDVTNWILEHEEEDEDASFFANNVRPVKRIHFHNYNNSWGLDVECKRNDYMALIDKDVDYLREAYDCHELDEMLDDYNKRSQEDRPSFFYFALGKILDKQGL